MNRLQATPAHFLLALIAALLLAILATLLVHRKTPSPAANLDDLKNSLQRTAEASLPTPTLTSEQISIKTKDGNVDSASASVIIQSESLGGTALKILDADGSVRLLVQISGSNAVRFRELVTGKSAPATTAVLDDRQLIEVIVTK